MHEHEYRRYSPGNPGNTHFGRLGWVAAASFLFALVLINLTVTKPLWRPYLGVQTKKLARLEALAPRVDILFVGPSHIDNGVDPAAFDAVALQCDKTFSFNAAVGDLRGPELTHYLEAMSRVADLRPKYVFLEPLINPTPTANRLFASRARYHFSWGAVQSGIKARWQADLPLGRKIGSIAIQLIGASIHELNLGVVADVLLPRCPTCEFSERESGPPEERPSRAYDRGYAAEVADPKQLSHIYYAQWLVQNGNKRLVDEAGLKDTPRQLGPGEVEYLGTLFAQIRALGAEPVALFPPLSIELGDQRAIYEGIRAHFPQVVTLSYIYDGSRLAELFAEPRAWFDHTHMSPYGARLFSTQMAADYCRIVKNRKEAMVDRAVH
jgi:hypothetical protein